MWQSRMNNPEKTEKTGVAIKNEQQRKLVWQSRMNNPEKTEKTGVAIKNEQSRENGCGNQE